MSTFSLETLTEGIRERHVGDRNRQLMEKWNRTGLLRGLEGVHRENMAQLLENQASQVLKEQSTLGSAGQDIRGFTNIAFPIVRRVFGGLVANELVSIQPMSLPSGLLFYLDYTYGTQTGGSVGDQAAYSKGDSIYNNPTGKGVLSGSTGVGGQYDLAGTGYSKVHKVKSNLVIDAGQAVRSLHHLFGVSDAGTVTRATAGASTSVNSGTKGLAGKLLQFDPQLTRLIEDGEKNFAFILIPFNTTNFPDVDPTQVKQISLLDEAAANNSVPGLAVIDASDNIQGGTSAYNVRRLNQLVTAENVGGAITAANIKALKAAPLATTSTANAAVLMVVSPDGGTLDAADFDDGSDSVMDLSYVQGAGFPNQDGDGSSLVVPAFESDFSTGTPAPAIPEIDIKIESVAVVAQTRKLRARWSPELAQDLNAYHSLDAEVELTQILSEQVALEIDREILNDLLTQADTGFFWSRAPGKFVNKRSGTVQSRADTLAPGPAFTGTVREWYETLVETIIDVANEIHRKTLRGSANFIVVSPDVATILEASVLYRPSYSLDGDGQVGNPMTLGCEKVGTLSNRFTVYKDPYFPRNKILVGYKGGSYLETGYVYAPYVPLIVTPTIFAPEDFTPRKGVMTRYGKKMVRSDFYGTVTCMDMDVI